MANTQTSVPAFTAGQVLTAQQQTEINTGIPVFATTTTRDAAFGGTGEKTLAEGQFAYIEASNTTQYYDGAAWQTLGGGLTYLTGASFTTATSFSLPNDTFTSSYTNYRIQIVITAVTADSIFTMRLRAAGSDNTATQYEYGNIQSNSSNSTISGVNAVNQTSWNLGEQDSAVVRYRTSLDIMTPQLAQPTAILGNQVFVNDIASATLFRVVNGYHTASTSFDSLSFISSVASSITGSYRVYGYSLV